jgi:hypothetical protein
MRLGGYGLLRGHELRYDEDVEKWRYADDLSLVEDGERPCATCGEMPTALDHDACIANLPGVSFACCGHGVSDKEWYPYVSLDNGRSLYGEAAAQWIRLNRQETQQMETCVPFSEEE